MTDNCKCLLPAGNVYFSELTILELSACFNVKHSYNVHKIKADYTEPEKKREGSRRYIEVTYSWCKMGYGQCVLHEYLVTSMWLNKAVNKRHILYLLLCGMLYTHLKRYVQKVVISCALSYIFVLILVAMNNEWCCCPFVIETVQFRFCISYYMCYKRFKCNKMCLKKEVGLYVVVSSSHRIRTILKKH